jgi:large subunit ribosomal protein L13e
LNVQRLKAYQSKLVVFPKKAGKPQKGDTTDKALLEKAGQLTGALFPVQRLPAAEAPRAITAAEKSFSAYSTLRKAFIDAKYVGIREKRAKERAAEAEAAAQK